MFETLASAGAGWLVSKIADLGFRAIRGTEEERAVRKVTEEALIGTLRLYPEQVDDEEVWTSFLEEFFTDPLVSTLLLRAVYRQEKPDVKEIGERLRQVSLHVDRLQLDFDAFLAEFAVLEREPRLGGDFGAV
jgi:hypothetical protein